MASWSGHFWNLGTRFVLIDAETLKELTTLTIGEFIPLEELSGLLSHHLHGE